MERNRPSAIQELVLDDWILLKNGGQIVADAQVLEGEIEVNEALITGEPDAILKRPGDCLLSGSFVTSGHCLAQVKHVGADNYAASITEKAKVLKEARSELMGFGESYYSLCQYSFGSSRGAAFL